MIYCFSLNDVLTQIKSDLATIFHLTWNSFFILNPFISLFTFIKDVLNRHTDKKWTEVRQRGKQTKNRQIHEHTNRQFLQSVFYVISFPVVSFSDVLDRVRLHQSLIKPSISTFTFHLEKGMSFFLMKIIAPLRSAYYRTHTSKSVRFTQSSKEARLY